MSGLLFVVSVTLNKWPSKGGVPVSPDDNTLNWLNEPVSPVIVPLALISPEAVIAAP